MPIVTAGIYVTIANTIKLLAINGANSFITFVNFSSAIFVAANKHTPTGRVHSPSYLLHVY